MAEKNILMTTLGKLEERNIQQYFYFDQESGRKYCEAICQAEASAKCLLSRVELDQIIVLGSGATYDEGDGLRQIELRDWVDFDVEDISKLSEYSFFRYRISQFLDKLDLETSDSYELVG